MDVLPGGWAVGCLVWATLLGFLEIDEGSFFTGFYETIKIKLEP